MNSQQQHFDLPSNFMAEQLLMSQVISQKSQMLRNKFELEKAEESNVLSSLTLEVDDIFFSLRKADQIIRRELNLLKNHKGRTLKQHLIPPLNVEKIQITIDKLMSYKLLVDEYIIYMLENHDNGLLTLIHDYNKYLTKREQEIGQDCSLKLIDIDEKLVHHIRHLGAMIYHLNINLNLLIVLLKNASVTVDNQQTAIIKSQEAVREYMVKQWGKKQQSVRFLEVTVDGTYAILTWGIEDLRGDAILWQNDDNWQLMTISPGILGLTDFENVNIPLDVAQRMLRLHHQKLGY
jgi:hypothetical protein